MSTMSLSSGARAARWATLAIFFLNGFGTAAWAVRIPAVQDRLGVSDGAIGAAITGIAVGSIVTVPFVGAFVSRFGSRAVILFGVPFLALDLLFRGLAPNLPLLWVALVLGGASTAVLDVAMNSQGVAVEREYGRPLISTFTAMFSLGGITGSAFGGVLAGNGVSVGTHYLIVSSLLIVVVIAVHRLLLPASVDVSEGSPRFARPSWTLLGILLIMFCIFLVEGAVGDWSAIYLNDTLGMGAGFAAFGFTAFTTMQLIGRLVGDRVMMRVSAAWLVRAGAVFAGTGFAVSLIIGNPYLALVGFGAIGLGISVALPAALSAAGRVGAAASGVVAGPALAAIGIGQYTGAFLGSPTIGFTSDALGLDNALFIVVALCVVIIPLAGVLGTGIREREAHIDPSEGESQADPQESKS